MKSSFFYLVIWLAIFSAALSGYGFWYSAIADKSAAVADLQNQIDTRNETANRITSAKAILAEIAGDELVVQSYFVPETGVVSFIDDLESRARAQMTTVKVLSVSVGKAAKQQNLVLAITINGTFDAVMRTVGAIEYAPYNLSISKLSLGNDGKGGWHANLDFVVGSTPASVATSTKAVTPKITI